MCHVHLPRARPARQPPSLHHREAGLCQLGSDVQHPFLPAGLESAAVTEKQHGNHSLSPIAEDVTLTRAFKDLQLPQTDHWLIPAAVWMELYVLDWLRETRIQGELMLKPFLLHIHCFFRYKRHSSSLYASIFQQLIEYHCEFFFMRCIGKIRKDGGSKSSGVSWICPQHNLC